MVAAEEDERAKRVAAGGRDEEEKEIDLASFAKKVAAKAKYQDLAITIPLDFEMRQIQVNKNGGMLSIIGDHKVVVVVLPMHLRTAVGKPISVQASEIGSLHHTIDDVNRVVEAKWHPASESRMHLVVLSSNSVVRIYDVKNNPDDPEQTYSFSDLSPTEDLEDTSFVTAPPYRPSPRKMNRAGMFTPDVEELEMELQIQLERDFEAQAQISSPQRKVMAFAKADTGTLEAASFGFGSGRGWGPFTLYCLMRNGSVYALCPVIPSRCIVSVKHLKELKSLNHHLWKTSDPNDEYVEQNFYWRNRWIDELLASAEAKNRNKSAFANPGNVTPPRQHSLIPIPASPFSTAEPDASTPEVSDLVGVGYPSVASKFMLKRQGPFAVNNVLIETESVQGTWNIFEEERKAISTPQLFLYERVELGTEVTANASLYGSVMLSQDPKYSDTFYASHPFGLHFVSVRPWVEFLLRPGPKPVGERVAELLQKHKFCQLLWLLNTKRGNEGPQRTLNPVVGFAVITDLSLDYSFVVMTGTGQLYLNTLAIRPKLLAIEPSSPKAQPAKVSQPSKAVASLLQKSLRELQPFNDDLVRRYSSQTPFILPAKSVGSSAAQKYPEFITEDVLKAFSANYERFSGEMTAIKEDVAALKTRVKEMVKVMENQIDVMKSISAAVDEIRPKEKTLTERLQTVQRKGAQLNERFEKTIRRLEGSSTSELTQAEKDYFAELANLEAKVTTFYTPKLEQLGNKKDQLVRDFDDREAERRPIAPQLKTIGPMSVASPVGAGLSSSQMKKINEALAVEYSMLMLTYNKHEELRRRLDAVGN
ncbi:hypothetical protein HK101_010482 [Irineochytrium annulatum]|nr:hypothetical protein HK101_010482 [Irineochytrium annulatum]